MKHCKCEFSERDYERIREAAWRSRLPIKQWVQQVAASAAAQASAAPVPGPVSPVASGDTRDTPDGPADRQQ